MGMDVCLQPKIKAVICVPLGDRFKGRIDRALVVVCWSCFSMELSSKNAINVERILLLASYFKRNIMACK